MERNSLLPLVMVVVVKAMVVGYLFTGWLVV
jgi:hypothetical protein